MRKKRNFDERMQACERFLVAHGSGGIKNMQEAVANFRDCIDYKSVFGNDHPVELEIGCGKGGFILSLAKKNPNVNYLALEKMSNVVLTPMEETARQGLENVRFLNIRAEVLPCFIKEHSLRAIYLNFSTPLPKLGYASQRLTHENFLKIYERLLVSGGKIIQKTDDKDFFLFSLGEYEKMGFTLEEVNYDLHQNGNPEDNIQTEYERKWVEMGKKIHRAVVIVP